MSRLAARLNRIRENFEAHAPKEALDIMHGATDALRASGITDRIAAVGSKLPAFELEDTDGTLVRSEDLLGRGPLIVTFYRGLW